MIKVFSHENPMVIHNLKNLLELENICCKVKNDLMTSSSGEVPPIEVWPELWVENESDLPNAKQVIKHALEGDPSRTSWFCKNCSETNPPAFELCWQCGKAEED